MSQTTERQLATTATFAQTITLGSLLQSHRVNSGHSVQTLASRTGLSATAIRSVEAGRHDLGLDSLARLIEAYKPPTLIGSGRWADVVVDIESASVALVGSMELVSDLEPADRILAHYLGFLYADRDLPMGTRLSIREVDLSVVRDSLSLRRDAVAVHIERLDVGSASSTDRNNLVLLTGLLCATAALVVGGGSTSHESSGGVPEAVAAVVTVEEAPSVPTGELVVEIGTAASITRAPATTKSPIAGAQVNVEIGTAVVEER